MRGIPGWHGGENMCSGAYALEPSAFYLHDHLGSTVFTLSHSGEVSEQLVNYPYGNPRLEAKGGTASFPADYKFTGKERDLESGLQYFEARYYSGVLGRFNRVDPLAGEVKKEWLNAPQQLNFYTYTLDNPINFTDPLGLWAGYDDLAFAGGGAIAGLVGQGISDLITGKLSGWEAYVGSAIGGAVAGEVLLYTGNPILAGGAGGLTSDLTKQGLENVHSLVKTGKWSGYNPWDTVASTGFGLLGGRVGAPKIRGINTGRNSLSAITKQMVTKFKNAKISRVSFNTMYKNVYI